MTAAGLRPDLPVVHVATRAEWRGWLAREHAASTGVWVAKVNKDRVERLLARGLVAPAGRAAIEQARADGSWTKLDEVDRLAVPDDLAAALDAQPPARTRFEAFPPSTRRGILEWISTAKTAPTRAKRVEETATLAAQNLRANQWPRR